MQKERILASDPRSSLQNQSCTCGHYERVIQSTSQDGLVRHAAAVGLEASFVHLPFPPHKHGHYGCNLWMDGRDSNNESRFLETLVHSSELIRAAEGEARSQGLNDPGISLCQGCVERAATALDSETERLKQEAFAYTHAVELEEERLKILRQTLTNRFAGKEQSGASVNVKASDSISRTAEAFHDEIEALRVACEQHEQEFQNLKFLEKEQSLLSRQLAYAEDDLWQERNALELEARAFDNVQAQLSAHVMKAQQEVDALSRVKLHSTLFDLVVDKRGLRYPLINELRLAYRPKGDVRWNEITAAWSQAAQLLLFAGASVNFRSRDWRIVPLISCAKIISLSSDGKHRAVYNLGCRDGEGSGATSTKPLVSDYSMAVSLCALNSLLDQMISHTISVVSDPPALPFEISRHRIGSYDLSHLDESNDSGWSRVIHCMACNLQWLSECASDCIIQNDVA